MNYEIKRGATTPLWPQLQAEDFLNSLFRGKLFL